MASSILLDRNPEYCDIQRHIIPFTDYSLWERRKPTINRRYSAATRTPTRSKTPLRGQPKSILSAKDYLLKVIMPIGKYFSLSLLFVNTMATVHCF